MLRNVFAVVGAGVLLCAGVMAAEPPSVTFVSLLEQMTDLGRLAEMSDPVYTCRQASSYDRKSTDPMVKTDQNWFANHDYAQFVRIDGEGDSAEHVLLDTAGPGAIVRFWTANPEGAGEIRFYFDGSDTPDLALPLTELVSGEWPHAPAPIAGIRSKGWNCYLPLPYAKHCKITATKPDFYYHVGYRTYEDGVAVETFSPSLAARQGDAIGRAAARLSKPAAFDGSATTAHAYSMTLAPGGEWRREIEGPAAIRRITCAVEADNVETALRGCLLEVWFDGEDVPSVLAPLGDFFGTAPGLNTYASLTSGVTEDGMMYSHWVMPFGKRARFRVTNHGTVAASFRGEIATAEYGWSRDSLHFHAQWKTQRDIPTMPRQDWNVLTSEGRGRYAGMVYHVANPVINWWGEGDEKVYVDGEDFPSTFGTGTEDYFGYAWCWWDPFTHAYHNQVRADGPGNFGHSCVSRFHVLDDIPFQDSIRFDIEVYHHNPGVEIDLATTAFWYARPGGEDYLTRPLPEELTVPWLPPRVKNQGVFEGEDLAVSSVSGGFTGTRFGGEGIAPIATYPCLLAAWNGHLWSGMRCLWWYMAAPGDVLEISFPSLDDGTYHVTAPSMSGPMFGTFKISVNGKSALEPLSLRHKDVRWLPEFSLGVFELQEGGNVLRVEVLPEPGGHHPGHALFSLDYLRTVRMREDEHLQ